jgi:uncharacterized membrane protein
MATATSSTPAHGAPVHPGTSKLTVAIVVIALIGLADAAFLTYVHYHGFSILPCVGGHHGISSCETVQSSVWSRIDGVPVALLGVIGYLALLASLRVPGDLGRGAGFGIALAGFGFSAYLTYREAFSIHAYCEWCLGSAACLTILTVLTAVRFLRGAPAAA